MQEWESLPDDAKVNFGRYIFDFGGEQYEYQWIPDANNNFRLEPVGPYSLTGSITDSALATSESGGGIGGNVPAGSGTNGTNITTGNNTMADNLTNYSYDASSPWAGYDWRGTGTYSPQFGELNPYAQYSSIMATQMPNYYMPGYENMAARQFQPTYGRFLLGGYGGNGSTGYGTGQTFGDWYTPEQRTALTGAGTGPAGIRQGWNIATQLAGMAPGSSAWDQYAFNQGAAPLAESLLNEADVRAMALSRYYGGQTPQSSYAARQTSSAINNLYDRWQQRAQISGEVAPSQFIDYLGSLSQGRFGAYA